MKTIKIDIHRWLSNLSGKLILFLENALDKRLSAGGYDFDGALEEMNEKLKAAPFIEPIEYRPINEDIRDAVEEMYVINGSIDGTLNDIHDLIDEPFFDAFNNPHGIMEQLELMRLDKYQINNDVGITRTEREVCLTSGQAIEVKKKPETIGLRDLMNNDILAGINGVPSFTKKYRAQFEAMQEMNALDDDMSFNAFLDMLLKRSDIEHTVDAGWQSLVSNVLNAVGLMSAIEAITGQNPLTGELFSKEERQQAGFDAVVNIGIFAVSVATGGFAGAKAYGASIASSMQKSFWANTASSMAGGASSLVAVGVLDEMGAPRWVQTIGALTTSTVVGSGVGRRMSTSNAPVNVVEDWRLSRSVINVDGTLMTPELLLQKVRNGDVSLETISRNSIRKANFGEIVTDQHMRDLGWERISLDRVTNLDQKLQQGIDGVFFNPNGHPPFVITESKFGTSGLRRLRDGTLQMSDDWIFGELHGITRIDRAVGRHARRQILAEGYTREVVNISSTGEVTIKKLDWLGNVIKD